jgi:formate transporter
MTGSTEPTNRGIALLPAEIARKAETVGVQKTRRDILSLLALAVLAGAFIALGAMFATTVLAGADGVLPFGLSRMLAGVAFCLGLILVVLGGAELFTGNTLLVIAWAAGNVRLHEMLRAWLVLYVGNFIGAAGTALLVYARKGVKPGFNPPASGLSFTGRRHCELQGPCAISGRTLADNDWSDTSM